jgi:two-component system, NarL family, sensor histidine kinase YdfH
MSRMLMEHSLYIVSECLTNVAKHAKADTVWVTVTEQNNRIEIEVKDNGKGFDTSQIGNQGGHYGLLGLYERVRLIGGESRLPVPQAAHDYEWKHLFIKETSYEYHKGVDCG